MDIDLEELKRLHVERMGSADGTMRFAEYLVENFPAILAKLEAAEKLHEKTATLYDYLLETDEEGLIHHAPQMRDVWLAVNKYRNAGQAFDKETE